MRYLQLMSTLGDGGGEYDMFQDVSHDRTIALQAATPFYPCHYLTTNSLRTIVL